MTTRKTTGGNPNTLIVDIADLENLPNTRIALTALKAQYDLPSHAPIAADNGGEWLEGWAIFTAGEPLPKEGGWYVIQTLTNGMRLARHSTIG